MQTFLHYIHNFCLERVFSCTMIPLMRNHVWNNLAAEYSSEFDKLMLSVIAPNLQNILKPSAMVPRRRGNTTWEPTNFMFDSETRAILLICHLVKTAANRSNERDLLSRNNPAAMIHICFSNITLNKSSGWALKKSSLPVDSIIRRLHC